jgi:hypothetical protein
MNDTDSGFPYLSSSKSIASRLADLNYQNKIQLIQKLQDVSAMLVMDYLTSQQDRFGNQHYVLYHRYQTEQGEFKKVKAKKYSVDHENKLLVNKKDESKTIAFQDIAENIKVLMLKDNDCGVIKSNKVKNNRMLNKLRHMDYDLYQKVLLLSEKLKQTESQDYFKKYAKYSNWEAQKLQKDASDVSNLLKTHCKNGHLKLDLGFEQALGGQSQYDTTDCELNSKYLMHSLYNINFDFDAILYKI